jgi:RNase P/RNase MRP subunit p29
MPIMNVDEFLGLEVRVKCSTNPSLEGLSGKIVGETMKTFSIRTGSGVKMVPKDTSTFEVKLGPDDIVQLKGRDVARRLEERTWRYETQ